jgi:hypothetical protein
MSYAPPSRLACVHRWQPLATGSRNEAARTVPAALAMTSVPLMAFCYDMGKR